MNSTFKVSCVVIVGVLVSIFLPHIITSSASQILQNKKPVNTASVTKTNEAKNNNVAINEKKDTAVPVKKEEVKIEQPQEEKKKETIEEKQEEKIEIKEETPEPAPVVVETKAYQDMTTEELVNAINNGSFKLEYSSSYNTGANKLTKSKGVVHYNNHKETYYSEIKLPGSSLRIPGRHVAEDGTIRDGEGYISVAASTSYLSRGSIVKTSLGPGKVYDSGCASGTIDIYTRW